ncbi:MAG TPA: TetR/AcrR family transcriptional regulator [Streptosporangiaceae bacterium]|nr:TetR/AcrR family transcriptional regulator [Streptosporangiaceae bacterium]
MGNREDLLAGAKQCLIEKGYARTTARDIAAASGVSLAAIGYHFGSKDALLNQAIYELIGQWGEEVERALSAEGALDTDPLRRFETIMERTFESFRGPARGLWTAQLELMGPLEHNDELRRFLAGVQSEAATGLAELFLGIDPATDPAAAQQAGAVLHAMFIGFIVKWFMDPEKGLSAPQLAEGMRIIGEYMSGTGRTIT